MNESQIAEYVENRGSDITCPECESESVELYGYPTQMGYHEIYQKMECRGCGKEWTDIYQLVSIRV